MALQLVDGEAEDALIPISALQHYLFCPRQCALIHVEQLWAEDGATVEGRILHDRVDRPGTARRAGVRTVRGLALRSLRLGVVGKADAVEMHGRGTALSVVPVEYKRGRPKAHRADEVQLCAQAMCLEEMLSVEVPQGALFYGQTRRRAEVVLDAELRRLTTETVAAARAMIAAGCTPPPRFMAGCRRCSLHDLCRPRELERPRDVGRWLARQLA